MKISRESPTGNEFVFFVPQNEMTGRRSDRIECPWLQLRLAESRTVWGFEKLHKRLKVVFHVLMISYDVGLPYSTVLLGYYVFLRMAVTDNRGGEKLLCDVGTKVSSQIVRKTVRYFLVEREGSVLPLRTGSARTTTPRVAHEDD